jgi:hypothetical protein
MKITNTGYTLRIDEQSICPVCRDVLAPKGKYFDMNKIDRVGFYAICKKEECKAFLIIRGEIVG